MTVGGTSKLVDRIEAAGLIARAPDPDDRRAARVRLTGEGERKLKTAVATYEEEAAAFLGSVLSASEQQRMHTYVTRLLAAARAGEAG